MNVSGYSPEDIVLFRAVLDATRNEAIAVGREIPVELMARRLFRAAETGERDPRRLIEAVLGDASKLAR
jgi:hypothetical protein